MQINTNALKVIISFGYISSKLLLRAIIVKFKNSYKHSTTKEGRFITDSKGGSVKFKWHHGIKGNLAIKIQKKAVKAINYSNNN